MEKATGLKLYPAYTYARIYKKGDELKRHKDRFSCEISTTMNLGGDDWPIYLEPSGEEGKKGIKVDLKPGDMLVYSGCELEHWREKFKGKECVQVFLHYNNRKTPGAKDNMFDKRPHLGLPSGLNDDIILRWGLCHHHIPRSSLLRIIYYVFWRNFVCRSTFWRFRI